MPTDPRSPHYGLVIGGQRLEVADVQKAMLDSWGGNPYVGHCLATALKYIFRCDKKGDQIRDLVKATIYLLWALLSSSGGRMPSELIDAFAKLLTTGTEKTKTLPEDMFEPIEEDPCAGGFCPMPKP